MALFALTTFGPDRPGTMARLSQAVAGIGGNFEDVSATILRGHGALMMIVNTPATVDAAALEAAARSALAGTDVSVNVQKCVSPGDQPAPVPTHVLSVYGADRPGIVHQMTTLLSGKGINITDLDSRIVGRADRPIYAMLIEMDLPATVDVDALRSELADLGRALQVDVSLRDVD